MSKSSQHLPQIIVITGMAGAGKSSALKVFEDSGWYCIDNLPSFLLGSLLDGVHRQPDFPGRIALVMDARDEGFLAAHDNVVADLAGKDFRTGILFLDAADVVLIKRFSQLRRPHPLAIDKTVRQGIDLERRKLAGLKAVADTVIDTSDLTPNDLRNRLLKIYGAAADADRLQVNLLSFGFKHGLPQEADLVLDVRFLPNPFYVDDLRNLTGLDPRVAAYALDNGKAREFVAMLGPLLAFLIPQYREAGKFYLTIGIGCTGGRHRSVAVSEALRTVLAENGQPVTVSHRDMRRE